MWRNYLTVGFRTMLSNRVYTLINVIGLAVGVAAAALIFLYVRYESNYDRWLPDSERIHQLHTTAKIMGPEPTRSAVSPRAAVVAMEREFPEIEDMVGLTIDASVTKVGSEPRSARIFRVDPDFFTFFDLPFVSGNAKSALADTSSLVLTQSEAEAYFGTSNPIGRTIETERNERKDTLRVTGVIADLPGNSHLDLGLIARFDPAEEESSEVENWGAMTTLVYAKLKPGVSVEQVNARMPAFEKRSLGFWDKAFDYSFGPIRDIHLSPPLQGSLKPGGDALAVRAFSVIAGLILLIACFNFTNLATAKASQRAREVGLRKVLGASRSQLVTQFMAESMLFAGVGTLIGLALVELLLPFFNSLLGVELSLVYLGGEGILVPALLLTLLVGTVSGFYPAIYLSRFKPGGVLRAAALPGAAGSGRLRNILVIGQFSIAIALMVCAAIVYAQTMFARQADPGFRHRGLMVIDNLWMPGMKPAVETLRDEIAKLSGVAAASLVGSSPAGGMRIVSGVGRLASESKERPNIDLVSIDHDLPATMGIPLIAGRSLTKQMAGDTLPETASLSAPLLPSHTLSSARFNVVLNETAVRMLDFADAEEAIGTELSMAQGRATVVGVVGDVRYGRLWRRLAAETPYSAKFVEDVLAEHYRADAVRGQIFAIAAALAVAIACLGLFGLAAFTVERRKLEIAVRKVFGAGDRDIVRLMLWQFSRPVLVANLIAWPVAWWLMRHWLNGFGKRIPLHPGWFLAAGAVALGVAALAVSSHALRASRTSPAHALRYE